MTPAQVAANHRALRNLAARLERMKRNSIEVDGSGCWLWRGVVDRTGYGRTRSIKDWRKFMQAHRFVYEVSVGPIPDGLQLDHLCRVRHCVNPSHLEPVTQQENLLRGKTIVAANAVKTHCPKRHEYAGDNLILDGGTRKCRECLRVRAAEKRARIRAERDAA